MTPEKIELLLHEEEGTTLDFKRDQYTFEGASKEEKSELLKDILAFSNAFRRSDAYILIGVEEVRGGRSTVVGIKTHLDDAKLQQFVNGKTQNPVIFSYRALNHDGRSIGIIHIPIQDRPIYAKSDYGKVRKEKVYLRRGSSTGVAKPDEIARMGSTFQNWVDEPSVELNFVDRDSGRTLGDHIDISVSTLNNTPGKSDIPDYSSVKPIEQGNITITHVSPFDNADFYRDFAAYIRTESCFPIALELTNLGRTVILDVGLVIELQDPDQEFELLSSQSRPKLPSPSNSILFQRTVGHSDVHVVKEGDTWKVECTFGKVQPRAKVRIQDDLLIGCRSAREVTIHGTIYADNISSPIPVRMHLSFQERAQSVTIEEIKSRANSLTQEV